jgi:murein DD-endopeptidase MepM/ murein hydrolase activator NlpD
MYRTVGVEAQALPAPGKPATVASNNYGGVSAGAQGLGAYHPSSPSYQPSAPTYQPSVQSSDITGSVPERQAALPPKPAGHWSWDGGKPVIIGRGENVETLARRYGVPAAAILQTNGIANAASLRPGQRLVIPRYVHASAAPAPVTYVQPPRAVDAPPRVAEVREPAQGRESVHVVQPGESLMSLSRHYGVSLSALARANHVQPFTKIGIGERVTIPAGARRQVAMQQAAPEPAAPRQIAAREIAPRPVAAPQVAQPRSAPPVERVASAPAQPVTTQSVQMASQETPAATENPVKKAEAAGSMPSFRWPVVGRVIAGFGQRPNGTQNDGINLAVPEGTPIKAAEDGVVAYAGNELKGYGNLVLIRHANGFVSAYANASSLLVKRGDSVRRGQVIAHAGQTGNVTSPQLHFEIRKGSTPVDPTKYLSGA